MADQSLGALNVAVVPEAIRPLLAASARVGRKQRLAVYAVGGCVRDWLLGLSSLDLDVVVAGDGVAFAGALAKPLRARVVEHGAFGTATLTCPDQRRVDVASARTERYRHPGAYPSVSPGSIQQDLARRDFTINAMAVRLGSGRTLAIVDPYNGRADLADRRIRALHPKSFLDDPTRIFRAVRFAQRFDFTIEPMTERWIREAVVTGALERVQPGRIRKELVLIAGEPLPWTCLKRFIALVTM